MLDSVEEKEELNFVGKTRTPMVKVKLQFKKKGVKQKNNQSGSCKSTQRDQRTKSRKSRASKKIFENAEESRSDEQTYENNFNPITSSSDQSDPASSFPRTLADKEIKLSGLT